MFIRFHPKTFVIKTLCMGTLSFLTCRLTQQILQQTISPAHLLLGFFYYGLIFLILFTVYSFHITVSEQAVTCSYTFQKIILPLPDLTISIQYNYQGIPYPFPVHLLKSGTHKVEIPYFVFGKEFHRIAAQIHQAQRAQEKADAHSAANS